MNRTDLAPLERSWSVTTFDVTEDWGDTELTVLLPDNQESFAWLGPNTQLVGWGEAERFEVLGPERFSRAQRWWNRLVSDATSPSEIRVADQDATAPRVVAFVSFGFFDEASSVLVVPNVIVLREEGRTLLTLVGSEDTQLITPQGRSKYLAAATQRAERRRAKPAQRVTWLHDADEEASWSQVVSSAVDRISRGELDKVVIARTASAKATESIDTVACLNQLSEKYPTCWAFQVDDLFGATPELLVAKRGDLVHSKVLAGTIHSRAVNDDESAPPARTTLAATLLESAKDLAEHEYAVTSVANALAHHCDDLVVPKRPSVLSLHGISHLATEVTGQLVDGAPLLALAASLHPTAAVCGTPRERAMAVIQETETIERGRYAGPVGWVDSLGDGELGIALRCAQITGDELIAYAGCGLVSESQPAQEWQESEAKLEAIKGVFAS